MPIACVAPPCACHQSAGCWIPTTTTAALSLQGKQILVDGIGRASEVEAETDPIAARAYLQHPDGLLGLDMAPITSLKSL